MAFMVAGNPNDLRDVVELYEALPAGRTACGIANCVCAVVFPPPGYLMRTAASALCR